jgi:hypothetical protein
VKHGLSKSHGYGVYKVGEAIHLVYLLDFNEGNTLFKNMRQLTYRYIL